MIQIHLHLQLIMCLKPKTASVLHILIRKGRLLQQPPQNSDPDFESECHQEPELEIPSPSHGRWYQYFLDILPCLGMIGLIHYCQLSYQENSEMMLKN